MIVQVEVSFYPLRTEDVGLVVDNFLTDLQESGLQIQTGPMSTRVTGELTDVFSVLAGSFEKVAAHSQGVLVIKASNACPSAAERE